jgi:hypothetical protein
MLGFFPDTARTTLRYVEKRALTATTGVGTLYQYRGNSVYDPNYTGTGGQPANYDDLAARYSRYRVIGSKITFVTAASSSVMDVVLHPSNSSTSPTVVDQIAQPYAIYGMSGSNGLILSNAISTQKIVGRDPMKSDQLQALYNADPAEEWLWNISVNGYDASTTAVIQGTIIIDYDVMFFDRLEGNLDVRLKRLLELKEHQVKRGQQTDCKTVSHSCGEFSWEDVPRQSLAVELVTVRGSDASCPPHVKPTIQSGPTPPPSMRAGSRK